MTGGWLFLGAQHSSSVGSTIHYTSPRLARDASEEIGGIVTDFHTLMTQLLHSRRTEALSLQRQLLEVEERNKEIAESNEVLGAKVNKMEHLLQNFADRLGVDAAELLNMTSVPSSSRTLTQ